MSKRRNIMTTPEEENKSGQDGNELSEEEQKALAEKEEAEKKAAEEAEKKAAEEKGKGEDEGKGGGEDEGKDKGGDDWDEVKSREAYENKRKQFDRVISKKEEELREAKKALAEARAGKPAKEKFKELTPDEVYELAVTDPAKHKAYKIAEKEALFDEIEARREKKEKAASEKQQVIDIKKALHEEFPELNPDDEKFDKKRYDRVNDFMIANGMDIRQAKFAAEHTAYMDSKEGLAEKAKQEAARAIRRKGADNIDKEEPRGDKDEGDDASAEEIKAAAKLGLTVKEYMEGKDLLREEK
jgi:hypothetical protein